MNRTKFNLDLYLKRIHYKGGLSVSLDVLFKLHNAQVFTVPFENLDIHLGKTINLDIPSLFTKIVLNGRGGYCYELNSLFQAALLEIGFEVESHLARTMLGYDKIRPKTHQILSVWLDGERWLVDLGFGGNTLISPLKYEINGEVKQFTETYRILRDDIRENILQILTPDGWLSLYSFNFEKQMPIDYFLPNYFNSTSPDSIFPNMRICNIATPTGRIMLNDMEFKIRENGSIKTRIVKSNEEYLRLLHEYFSLTFPLDTVFNYPLEK